MIDESFKLYISIGISCIVLANIMTYYFFMIINKEYERAFELEIQKQQYEQQITSQSKHIDEILVMQKQIKKLFNVSLKKLIIKLKNILKIWNMKKQQLKAV